MLFVLLHSITRPDCTWIPLSSFGIPFFALPCFQAWHPSSLCLSVLLGLSLTMAGSLSLQHAQPSWQSCSDPA